MLIIIKFHRCAVMKWKLTDHIQIGNLTLHWIRIYLTHVPAHIRFLDISDFQYPSTFFGVRYNHSVIFGDYVTLDGEDCLSVDTQPCDLTAARVHYLKSASCTRRQRRHWQNILGGWCWGGRERTLAFYDIFISFFFCIIRGAGEPRQK